MMKEIRELYQSLNEENKEEVRNLIATLLNQQSNDPQSPDSQA